MRKSAELAERWGTLEITLEGPKNGNPFLDTSLEAEFRYKNRSVHAEGFYDGDGIYKIRFMPDVEGNWTFVTRSNRSDLNGITGSFVCTPPTDGNHGPVRVRNTYHFTYEDGTPHYSFGTTCYVWNHQGDELEEQTLRTLKAAPFNKLRMCVFPKDYDYNKNEPVYHAFEGSLERGWDFTRFNPAFFRHLEKRIADLRDMGIEADLILFHPYDRWGYAAMDAAVNDRYLRYIVARLAAYRNLWWSFANEYDLMPSKSMGEWDGYFKLVQECDPYQHLRSIHNCGPFYDHGKPWVTHCSIQNHDLGKVEEWRKLYRKPVVVDECCYEGNINHGWGNITGQEMSHRFWEGFVRGGYVGHGETYMHPEDILWWAKGGILHGTSPDRIAFLRRIVEEGPAEGFSPFYYNWDVTCGGKEGEFYLMYFGIKQPSFRDLELPAGNNYTIDIIDTWEMTVTKLEGMFSGKFRLNLPGKQYMAVRIRKCR